MPIVYHQPILFATSKICTECKTEKPLDQFSKQQHGKYGVHSKCKVCLLHKSQLCKKKKYIPKPKKIYVIKNTKVCTACQKEASLSDFGLRKKSPDKHTTQCKKCVAKHIHSRESLPIAVNGGKVCRICKIEKACDDFYREKRYKTGNGFHPQCKVCVGQDSKKRRDAVKQLNKQEVAIVPVLTSKICSKCKVEKDLSGFGADKYQKSGYACACKECSALHSRKWRKANPLRRREMWNRRRFRQNQAKIGKVDLEYILERDGAWCHICRKDIDLTIKTGQGSLTFDHVLPLAGKGINRGSHTEGNIKPAHHICNSRKKAKLLEELTAYDRRGVE